MMRRLMLGGRQLWSGSSLPYWGPLLLVAMLFTSPPALSAEGSVVLEQSGSIREPFDINGQITYRIPVSNDIGSGMMYTVELKVGPDHNDYSIYDIYNINLNVAPHSTGQAEFAVNFRSPSLARGEFGRW
ncbi:MAG: hypothetical protein QUS08_00015, partial [Methanothrix sp.]|nr:hypothetical protein [Methanothrix sp.]